MSIPEKQILVSIITVVFNGDKFLEQTIQSVINQSYSNIEYIIIDGGSTDNTINIIKKYKSHISCWVSEPDDGLYDAMNKGIALAKGSLIGMINSDDWYEPNAVKLMVNAFERNPTKKVFHANRYDVDENNSRKVRRFNVSEFKFKYYGMTYNHPSMFITKDEYEKHLYNTNLKALSDYQFVLEAFLADKNKFCYIDEVIVNYRLDGVSAQLKLFDRLQEGFLSRRYAGFNVIQSSFSLVFRFTVILLLRLKTKIKFVIE